MNNIESIVTQMIGNDPRFSRAVSMLQGKTPEQMQRLRPAPIPAFVVSNPLTTTTTTG